jgi:folate-binding protein YgfZ
MTPSDARRVLATDVDLHDYRHLTQDCGLVDLSDRTQLELSGGDRQRLLHNLSTNDIQRLQPGQGCESFITSVQGKCLGHVFVFAGQQSLIVETSPAQADTLLSHFDRYLINDDVQLHNHGDDWGELLLAGPAALALLRSLTADWALDVQYAHQAIPLRETTVWARRVPMTAEPTFLLACLRDELSGVRQQLQAAGAAACGAAAFHALRIEHAFPWYSWDISDKNLPQEVGRDAVAISFQKGCYLGQETVARIDALGHVNRLLVALHCAQAEVPSPGDELTLDGQAVGTITSSAYSPRLQSGLALAYVRSQHADPGTTLQTSHHAPCTVK